MRFKSNEIPFGQGGLFYKPRYNQRFISGGTIEKKYKIRMILNDINA